MTSEAAKLTFFQLKYFPRTKNGHIDEGRSLPGLSGNLSCVKCGEQLHETVSLEFCPNCGHVETDYWGLINGRT